MFGRALGIAHDPIEAAQQLLRSLAARSFTRIGVGAATQPDGTDRWFLFHLGVGFDAAVVKEMEERWYLKRYFAHPAFAIAAVDTWLRRYDREHEAVCRKRGRQSSAPARTWSCRTSIRTRTSCDAASRSRRTPASTARSPSPSCRTSAPRSWSAPRRRASRTGRFVATAPDIVQCADLTTITITADRPFQWQVDGDYLGHVDRLDIRYDADSLTIVTP